MKSSLLNFLGGKKEDKEKNYYDSNRDTYKNPHLLGREEYYERYPPLPISSSYDNHYSNNDSSKENRPYYYDFNSSKNDDNIYDSEYYRKPRHTRSASFSSLSSYNSDNQIRIRSKSVDPRPRPRSFFLGGGYYHQADSFHRSRSMDESYLDDPRVELGSPASSSSSSYTSDHSNDKSFNPSSKMSKNNIKYKPLPDVVISPGDDPKRIFRQPKSIHDPKIKYMDYQRKQKILGALQALSEGKLPTNKQLFIFINKIRNSRNLKDYSVNLSAEGKYLFNDWLEFLDIAYLMLQEKNKDESLQKFIYYSRLSSQTSFAKNFYHPMVDFIKSKFQIV